MITKLTFEQVSDYFRNQGCELLEREYNGVYAKLQYRCQCGNITICTFNNFQVGRRCARCGGIEKYTYQHVKNFFELAGYQLLETKYISANHNMQYRCPEGHESSIRWKHFMRGIRCGKCAVENRSGDKSRNWNPNRDEIRLFQKIRRKYQKMVMRVLNGKRKQTRSQLLLGYGRKQLTEHLMQCPNWTMLKDQNWELDHIFPIKAFYDLGIEDPKIINALDNLQPLSKRENIQKSDHYDMNEFKTWLSEKSVKYGN